MSSSAVFKFNSKKESDSWIAIGKLLRCVGLDGWVRVSIMTDYPERFAEGVEYHFQKKTGALQPCRIAEVRDHFSGNMVELRFAGYEHRDAITGFVGSYLVIPKSERAKADDESFYPDEIKDLDILDPEGKKVGRVVSLEADVPSPYLVISSDDYGEILVPFRKVFFSRISKKNKLLQLKDQLITHVPAN
jgi:16S rRNA processing protein RimM